jgi:hypothetical protein
MYKYLRQSDKLIILTVLAVVYLVGAMIGLIFVTYMIKRYGIIYEDKTRRWFNRSTASIKLGGTVLTLEAQRIRGDKSLRTLLDDANGKVENVFTVESLADVHIKTLMYFILFQSCATLSLFAASMLLGNNDG